MTDNQPLASISSRYQTLEVLGEGGMGRVYKARDVPLERTVAIKVLIGNFAHAQVPRFQREAKTMSSLKHPNLADVYDFGITNDGMPYLVMEFVVGTTLSRILKRQAPLSALKTINLTIELAAGMAHAHDKGFIHRDLKPANVLVQDETNVSGLKILDFGISKAISDDQAAALTLTGQMIGTPLYMSPEQAQSGKIDQRADIYSLGCIMYQCLCGKPPFTGATALDTVHMHANEPAKPLRQAYPQLEVPEQLDNLILKLLAKKPEDRCATMNEVIEELEIIRNSPEPAFGSQTMTIVTERLKHSKKRLLMSSIAIIVLLGASGIFAQQQQHQQLQPQETDRLPPSWQDFFEKKETEFIAKESGEVLPPPIPASAFALLPAQEVTWLNLHSRGVDDTAMEKYISKFPLTRLILQKGVNDKSLTQLNSLKNLVSLSLKDSREVNGSAFEELQLPKLQHLDLESVPITDEALVSISRNYPSLVTLVLTATKIKGTTLGELKQLKQLKNLQLRALSIPENDLDRLTDMPSLEAITISANPLLTESAIRKLCLHNKAITSVTVQDIYHIPEETFDRLRAEFKGTVSFDSHRRKDYDPLPEDTMKDILDADTSP